MRRIGVIVLLFVLFCMLIPSSTALISISKDRYNIDDSIIPITVNLSGVNVSAFQDIYFNVTGDLVLNGCVVNASTSNYTIFYCGAVATNATFGIRTNESPKISSIENVTAFYFFNSTKQNSNQLNYFTIADGLIFQTLVEFGRGKGNYFHSTYNFGMNTSEFNKAAKCTYLPTSNVVELNFLHKVFNVKPNVFRLAGGDLNDITDVSFTCSYPNEHIVRLHLEDSVSAPNPNDLIIDYSINQLKTDWDRIAYAGFDLADDYFDLHSDYNVTCNNLTYTVGNETILVDEHNISFLPADIRAIDVGISNVFSNASFSFPNGQALFPITYEFTNNQDQVLEGIVIDIVAPSNGRFVAVKGELSNFAHNIHRVEIETLLPNETIYFDTAIRFDMNESDNLSTITPFSYIDINYVPCWQRHSYNPISENFRFFPNSSYDVNYNLTSSLDDLISIILNINSTVVNNNIQNNNVQNDIDEILNEIRNFRNEFNNFEDVSIANYDQINSRIGGISRKINSLASDLREMGVSTNLKLSELLKRPVSGSVFYNQTNNTVVIQEQAPSSFVARTKGLGGFFWILLILFFLFIFIDYYEFGDVDWGKREFFIKDNKFHWSRRKQ